MPSHDYWETACKNAEFKHWEPEYPSPELSAPAASWFFRKNARVLDAGTGGGNDAVFPALCGLKVTAIDWSHAALQIAEQRALKAGVKVGFQVGSVLDLPFPKASFDYVIDRGLFHLLEDSECRFTPRNCSAC